MNTKPCKTCGSLERYACGSCKACTRRRNRKRYAENPEREKQYNAKYQRENPDSIGHTHRKYKYGITKAQFQNLLLAQNSKCAICLEEKPLQVDHCHVTDKVRGLLCGPCNRALGMLQENPVLTDNATGYLKKALVLVTETS